MATKCMDHLSRVATLESLVTKYKKCTVDGHRAQESTAAPLHTKNAHMPCTHALQSCGDSQVNEWSSYGVNNNYGQYVSKYGWIPCKLKGENFHKFRGLRATSESFLHENLILGMPHPPI
jgi:hypothetical protein